MESSFEQRNCATPSRACTRCSTKGGEKNTKMKQKSEKIIGESMPLIESYPESLMTNFEKLVKNGTIFERNIKTSLELIYNQRKAIEE